MPKAFCLARIIPAVGLAEVKVHLRRDGGDNVDGRGEAEGALAHVAPEADGVELVAQVSG